MILDFVSLPRSRFFVLDYFLITSSLSSTPLQTEFQYTAGECVFIVFVDPFHWLSSRSTCPL